MYVSVHPGHQIIKSLHSDGLLPSVESAFDGPESYHPVDLFRQLAYEIFPIFLLTRLSIYPKAIGMELRGKRNPAV